MTTEINETGAVSKAVEKVNVTQRKEQEIEGLSEAKGLSAKEEVKNVEATAEKSKNLAEKRKNSDEEDGLPVWKVTKIDDAEPVVKQESEVISSTEQSDEFAVVDEAEKEMLELAGVAASSSLPFTQTVGADEVVETEITSEPTNALLQNLRSIGTSNASGPVEIVVEQDAPVKPEQAFPQSRESQDQVTETMIEAPQTNTATVAAPQGVNPAMMSNLLHTAAAVAAAQNVAAATVQVIPGQAAGTIQLVPAADVQRTQELMAAGMPPQNVNQTPEELAKNTQPVFSYLVTSQGTLIAAHASDGSELISGSSAASKTKRYNKGRKSFKNAKGGVKKTELDAVGDDRKFLQYLDQNLLTGPVYCLGN